MFYSDHRFSSKDHANSPGALSTTNSASLYIHASKISSVGFETCYLFFTIATRTHTTYQKLIKIVAFEEVLYMMLNLARYKSPNQ